jgi:hypothetical protein
VPEPEKLENACKHGLLDYHPVDFAGSLQFSNVHKFPLLVEEHL